MKIREKIFAALLTVSVLFFFANPALACSGTDKDKTAEKDTQNYTQLDGKKLAGDKKDMDDEDDDDDDDDDDEEA